MQKLFKMEFKLIKSEKEYQNSLQRIDKLFHSKHGTKENDELEILIMLVERYETETVGEFPNPDPIEAIKFKLEQMGKTQMDLANILGLKSRASEVLSRKRLLNIGMIRKISMALEIPVEVLIQPYETA